MSNDPSAAKYQSRPESPPKVSSINPMSSARCLDRPKDFSAMNWTYATCRNPAESVGSKSRSIRAKERAKGRFLIPSSLDQVETAILASGLETVYGSGRVARRLRCISVEDIRISKRSKVVDRAKEILAKMQEESKGVGIDLTEAVRKSFQVEEITSYGPEHLPAGPNIDQADALIVVEGRSDVLNLLRCGIKNVIAVEGTSVPQTVKDLSRGKTVTVFTDGDRAGELILREMLQTMDIDFVARAPRGSEVEELTQKQLLKCLRNKIPINQYLEMTGFDSDLLDSFPDGRAGRCGSTRAQPTGSSRRTGGTAPRRAGTRSGASAAGSRRPSAPSSSPRRRPHAGAQALLRSTRWGGARLPLSRVRRWRRGRIGSVGQGNDRHARSLDHAGKDRDLRWRIQPAAAGRRPREGYRNRRREPIGGRGEDPPSRSACSPERTSRFRTRLLGTTSAGLPTVLHFRAAGRYGSRARYSSAGLT